MKIKIGPYLGWFGPYQLAEVIFFWTKTKGEYGQDEYPDWVDNVGEWLGETWVGDLLEWAHAKRKRNVKIQIDKYDTWSMDSTLAMIIVPMLKQLRDTTHGYPADFVYEDQSYEPQRYFEGEGFEFPDDGFEQWQATLDKMIWAFEQVAADDWESQYYSGKVDMQFKDCEDMPGFSEMVKGPNDTFVIDRAGIDAHRARMQEGFDLFAKYYEGLWD